MSVKNNIKKIINLVRTKEKVPIYVPVNNETLLMGKTAIVTGGSGGIGRAITNELVKCGCKVVIIGTNEVRLVEICNQYIEEKVTYIVMNMKDVSTYEEKISKIICDMKIDILVNCAGRSNGAGFFEVDELVYDDIMDINVKGVYFFSQIIAKHMIANGIKGHILNVSSSSALRPASTPYAISKWAINGMTKGLADILIPYGITVNAIAPGPTATEMLGKGIDDEIGHEFSPAGRYSTPQEIANLAIFMVSGMGDMIIGDTFYITGGSGTVSMHR